MAATIVCLLMAKASAVHPLVYWFGGWVPRPGGLVLGIGFVVDQAGAAMSAFIGLLFTLTLVFAWGWFDEVHAHFHVLMLLFMAGMIGFCLTHDLFDLFVWFEVIAGAFMHPQNRAILGLAPLHRPTGGVMPALPSSWIPWFSVPLAVAIAAYDLGRGHLPPRLIESMDRVLRRPLDMLREVHSGLVSDYVAWLAVGLALFAVAFALS